MSMSTEYQAESGYFIQDREGDRCAEVRIWTNSFRKWFPCGEVVHSLRDLRPGDYIVISAEPVKRDPAVVRALRRRGRHVADIEVRGADVAEIIQVT
jgi:hypothetical protein